MRALDRREALAVLATAVTGTFAACVRQRSDSATSPGVPVHFETIASIGQRVRTGGLSAVTLTEQMLARISTIDAGLHSYATVMRDQALTDARRAERELRAGTDLGPLHGIPIAIKDLCFTRGTRTMGGMKVLRAFVPTVDATVVSKLRQAGAILLGKLNLAEGAGVGYHREFDVPNNPWKAGRWAGASSSGSGIATAAGLCFAAVATDTGGSIRWPAAANGVVGIKPTYGRVSRHGVLTMAGSLDHVGTMGRSVADAALLLDAMSGHDPNDATTIAAALPSAAQLGQSISGLRIGLDRNWALNGLPNDDAAVTDALAVLTSLGATIVDVRVPDLSAVTSTIYEPLLGFELADAHRRDPYPADQQDYGAFLGGLLARGRQVTNTQREQAERLRSEFRQRWNAVFATADILICPCPGGPALPVSREAQYGTAQQIFGEMAAHLPKNAPFKDPQAFTIPMNVAGTPAVCVPAGFSPEGLPFSIQLTGPVQSEAVLCRVAHAYEQATTWHLRHPQVDV
jgi:amidase